ncbi:hypothetical protein [Planctomicrobium sp. SH664]|uniref:hypothetical protein n=1 Tax=Planctomicrobium sp. SH664 TaxID=3448125 RepID=UPI003F5C4499
MTLPAFVLAAARQETCTAQIQTIKASAAPVRSSCCEKKGTSESLATTTGRPVETFASAEDASEDHYVIRLLAEQCSGSTMSWTSMPWTIIDAAMVIPTPEGISTEPALTGMLRIPETFLPPPVPPPRSPA